MSTPKKRGRQHRLPISRKVSAVTNTDECCDTGLSSPAADTPAGLPAADPPASDPPAADQLAGLPASDQPASDFSTAGPTAVNIGPDRQSAPVCDPSMVETSAALIDSSFTLSVNSAFCHDYNTNVSEKILLSCHPGGQDCAISDVCDDENLSSALRNALFDVDPPLYSGVNNLDVNHYEPFSLDNMIAYLGNCEMEAACITPENNMPHVGAVKNGNKQMTDDAFVQESSNASPVESELHRITNSVSCGESNMRSRGRHKKDPSLWKTNIRKRLRNSGQSYVSRFGVQKRQKMMKPGCGAKCHRHCHQSISSDEREVLFCDFWKLGDLLKQREFIARHVTKKPVKAKICPSMKRSKSCAVQYSFTVNGKAIAVCKMFFLHTLDISEQMILTSINKVGENGHLQPEKRSLPNKRKLPFELRQDIMNHINKFPTVESHYCRKSSAKQYLPQGLNLAEMYRLYSQECMLSGKPVAKQWAYYDIFRKEFNLGFHKPKKDQCDFCTKYKHLDDDERASMSDKMEEHQRNKNLSRELKANLKERAKADKQINVACFDLQQVLLTPHSLSSQLFYRRKLSTYNLTVYDAGSKAGFCYMWHEGVSKRGANNVASCVWKYINDMSEQSKTEFHFFTDNCGGQNKNKLIVSMYFHAVRTLNVQRICHYYLEKGHTENEGDSMHSTIESAAKNVNIFSPVQWYTVASTAKKSGEKYKVVEMEGQMKDFRGLSDVYLKGSQRNIRWTDIKCLKVEKANPDSLFVKASFGCDDYKEIQFAGKQQVSDDESDQDSSAETEATRNQRDQTKKNNLPELDSESLVTVAKKNDLLWMCEQLIIPKDYHSFYKNLSVCSHTDLQNSELTVVQETGGANSQDIDDNTNQILLTSEQTKITRQQKKRAQIKKGQQHKNRETRKRKASEAEVKNDKEPKKAKRKS